MPVPRQNLLKGLKSIVFQRALALAQFLGLLLVLLKYLNFHQSFVLGVDVMQLDKLLIFGKERVQKLLGSEKVPRRKEKAAVYGNKGRVVRH